MSGGGVVAILAGVGIAIGAVVYTWRNLEGLSARAAPTALERLAARTARRLAIPAAARAAKNPIPFSPEIWAESRAHFADHCATCHANDGSGRTELGQNLFPRAPDMHLAGTQDFSDGELYWIIKNGVRLTGMPAWGTPGDNDADTWKLVHFIRHLAELTEEHLNEMKSLNPRSPAELEEERQDDSFLAGGDSDSTGLQHGSHEHQHEKETQ
jgi:mono/diheme cytochrome c family protein